MTRAYIAGFGTAGSLLAGASVLFVVATAVVSYRGWPQVANAGPKPALVAPLSSYGVTASVSKPSRGSATAFATPSAIPAAASVTVVRRIAAAVPRQSSAPSTLRGGVHHGTTSHPAPPPTVSTAPVTIPTPPPTPTTPTPAVGLGGVATQATGALGAGVSSAGKQVGATVGAITGALGGQLSQANPAVGGIVAGVGAALGNTVTGLTSGVGGAVTGTGQLLGGLLGGAGH
ncbi:MAG TPA: hypothetical protein VG294_17480 [Solirubrobacteraceae bacterium]|nr:hypothetical protein [Solirubrobacteraceae bacterium]